MVFSMPPPWTYRTYSRPEQDEPEAAPYENEKHRSRNQEMEWRNFVRLAYIVMTAVLWLGSVWIALGFLAFAVLADAWLLLRRVTKELPRKQTS
jgi:hypothetical protein